jgi:hypothetical protein
MEKDHPVNGAWEQTELTIFISDKTDFNPKLEETDRHITFIKGTINQE